MTYFYVYRITDVRNNRHYYGSRQSISHPLDDLGVKYFSSSLIVQREIRLRPSDFRYKVVFICKTRADAYRLERKIQLKLDVHNRENFYNLIVCGELYNRQKSDRKHSQATKNKLSAIMKEKMSSLSSSERSMKFGNFGVMNPMIRDGGHNDETRRKISIVQKQVAQKRLSEDPDYYRKMSALSNSPEAKAKQRSKTAHPFEVTFKTEKVIFTHYCDLGRYLGMDGQMGSRIVRNPHLWEKYGIKSIERVTYAD